MVDAVAIVAGGCGSRRPHPTTSVDARLPGAGPAHRRGHHPRPRARPALLGERLATVYYPADRASASGHPRFSYTEASTLPTALQPILPAAYNTTTTIDAYTDAPGSGGPYPVVLFSHGFGGERLYYSNLLAGMASWGYVVVSADYLERGLAAQALGPQVHPHRGLRPVHHARLARRRRDGVGQPASVLHGTADPSKVAAVGHSAGGGRPSTPSTTRGWPPPSAGPRSPRPARRRRSR